MTQENQALRHLPMYEERMAQPCAPEGTAAVERRLSGGVGDTVSLSHKGHQQELLLLRGVPGAGKSTFGRVLANQGWKHFEADMWRDHGEERVYNSKRNEVAHGWCLGQTAEALRCGRNVVVANVFSTIDKMKPYFILAEDLRERGHKIKVTVATIEGTVGRSVNTGVDYSKYINEWQRYVGEFDARAG